MRYRMTLEELHKWLCVEVRRVKSTSPQTEWGFGYREGYRDALEAVFVAILGEPLRDVEEPPPKEKDTPEASVARVRFPEPPDPDCAIWTDEYGNTNFRGAERKYRP